MKTPIQIWIVGQENFQVSHVFNSNAFPRHVKGLVVLDCTPMIRQVGLGESGGVGRYSVE